MKRRLLPIVLSLVAVTFFAVMWWLLHDKNIAILNPQGQIADQQKQLIIFTTLLGLTVILPVFGLLFGFIWKYRVTAKKPAAYKPDEDGNPLIETIWWGIPIVIIIVLGIVTWVSTHQLDPYRALDSQKKPLHVQVVALQWRWLFIYPEQQVASINELHIPTDRPIEFSITADSPMSAFWIPNLGSQTYAMNGMTAKLHLEADNPGEYRGTNSNISGEGYADMNFKVIATDDATFDRWSGSLSKVSTPLNQDSYAQLAKQTHDTSVHYYKLNDKDLYQRVLEKYMGHTDHGTSGHEDDTIDSMKKDGSSYIEKGVYN
jgi:cytochrome o ubiquinol oxidase subunit 2